MAGSFKHICDEKLEFRGIDLIGNLGDAHEALEECFDMILWLSRGDRATIWNAHLKGHLEKRYPNTDTQTFDRGTFKRYWDNQE